MAIRAAAAAAEQSPTPNRSIPPRLRSPTKAVARPSPRSWKVSGEARRMGWGKQECIVEGSLLWSREPAAFDAAGHTLSGPPAAPPLKSRTGSAQSLHIREQGEMLFDHAASELRGVGLVEIVRGLQVGLLDGVSWVGEPARGAL
jgi:hypothetical protein